MHHQDGSQSVLSSGHITSEEYSSKLAQVVGRIHVLAAVGLRALASCWLLAVSFFHQLEASQRSCQLPATPGHCLQFSATWAFPLWLPTSLSPKRESLDQVGYKMKSHLTSHNNRSGIHHFCHILLVRRKP